MFICPHCEAETDDPRYQNLWVSNGDFHENFRDNSLPIPWCACGKRLRNWSVGNFRVMSLSLAVIRGLAIAGAVVLIAAAASRSKVPAGVDRSFVLPIAIVVLFALGIGPLWYGADWSSRQSRVAMLAPRAYGTAIGFLLPAGLLAVAVLTGLASDLTFLDGVVAVLHAR